MKMAPSAENYSRYYVAISALGDEYEATHDFDKADAEYVLAQGALTKAIAFVLMIRN